MKKIICICLFAFSVSQSTGQDICTKLEQTKKKVYGFKPSDLSKAKKETKNKDLDLFWDIAKSQKEQAIPCLQKLIENEQSDSYFCWDASALLLQIDTSEKSLEVVILGLQKCDLEDLDLEPYLNVCFYLAQKGKNIGTLALKLISQPNATVFLTPHVITLSAIDASIFLFNTMPGDSVESLLINAILSGNSTAKHSAAVLLNLHSTEKGDQLLDSLRFSKQLEQKTIEFIDHDKKTFIIDSFGSVPRETILESLKNVPYNLEKEFFGFAGNEDLINSACTVLTKEDIGIIRLARQRSTPGLSDEALHEYFALTTILMTVRKKRN